MSRPFRSQRGSTPGGRRFWRRATVVPAVLSAVLGTAAVVAMTGAVPTTQASFADRNPVGQLGSARHISGGFRIVGWTFDYDKRHAALGVYARIDNGPWVATATANESRPALAKTHAAAGPDHGFTLDVPVPQGKHTVCVGARNIGKGHNSRLGCYTRTFDYGPFGAIDTLAAVKGAIHVVGWAIDPDAHTTPLNVDISIDGTAHNVTADIARKDVAAKHKLAGPDHGFATTIRAKQGQHTVCVIATNLGPGSDTTLGCSKVTLHDGPYGSFASLTRVGTDVRVRGWAFDPGQPTQAVQMTVRVDGRLLGHTLVADWKKPVVPEGAYPAPTGAHGFGASLDLGEGKHTVCLVAQNIGIGKNTDLGCKSVVVSYTPSSGITAALPTRIGATVSGWATDPDTTGAITANITIDGTVAQTVTANGDGSGHDGHAFSVNVPMTSGKHKVCVVGVNVGAGTKNSTPACRTVTLALSPLGGYLKLARASGSDDLVVYGWAFDPDKAQSPLTIAVTLDGKTAPSFTAHKARPGLVKLFPQAGANHGFQTTLTADDGEHTVCLTAKNVGGGEDLPLGCRLINAVHPVAPGAPRNVAATPIFGGAEITWKAPASDGGAPASKYVVTAKPGGKSVTVGGTTKTAEILGLKSKTSYTFSVAAVNVAGTSTAAVSNSVRTQAAPPPQTTPAPVSTSRYIRNIRGSSPAERTTMRVEGRADAKANPAGHGYLVLLDIGGQDSYDGGVVLSATTQFVTYSDLVADLKSYVAGYHSAQNQSAPVVIALGTNNDMDVSTATGKVWAQKVVNPVRRFAAKFNGLVVAGANDIEPGFRAGYAASLSWVKGYLSATHAPFVFNGSADGCAWTVTNGGCNNGWNMNGMYQLAAGAAPNRIINLPQIYNDTMAAQWKYISLTGLSHGNPRITFGGPLTEWTACAQAGGCGSLSGHSAWSALWNDLQSDSRLKVKSLPYSTDLRIDR